MRPYIIHDGNKYYTDVLCHHGVKGMKWGVRKKHERNINVMKNKVNKMGQKLSKLSPSEHDLNKVNKKFRKPIKKLERRQNLLTEKANKKIKDISTTMLKSGEKTAKRLMVSYGLLGLAALGIGRRLNKDKSLTDHMYRINL